MTLNFFSGLVSVFSSRTSNKLQKDMMLWAKTEYKNDWQYAYQVMMETGDGPKGYHGLGRIGRNFNA
jgi:hypothetical protein